MYTLLLVLSMLAVVLSPVLIDFYLSFREAQHSQRVIRFQHKKSPRVTWASPRVR